MMTTRAGSHAGPLFYLFLLMLLISFHPLSTYASENLQQRSIIARGDYDYPPFEFSNEAGEAEGFNVELLQAIAKEMDVEIIIDLGIWSEIRGELRTGEIDMITGMFQTAEREEFFDFSAPHTVISHAIYARKRSTIRFPSDLSGKTVVVQGGDVMQDYVRSRFPEIKTVTETTNRKVLQRLSTSPEISAALVSRIQAELIIQEEQISNLEAVGPPIFPRKYCFSVQKGNSDLLAILNDGLAIVKSKGVYDRLYQKWFGGRREGFYLFAQRLFFYLFIPLLIISAIIGLWIWSLRKSVQDKTRELERELKIRKAAEWRFRNVFEGVPVSIWEEDVSKVRSRIQQLQDQGVYDFRSYIEEHPEIIEWMVENIEVVDINPATLEMYKAQSKEQLLGSFAKVETKYIRRMLEKEFIAIAEESEYVHDETRSVVISGEEKTFLTTVFIPRPGSSLFDHMLVSMSDISEQKEVEAALARSNQEKDVLLKELHHRVKNNMQMMSSLIHLQSMKVQSEEVDQIVRTSENRIRAMAMIHELLYQSEDLTSIELGYYLESVAKNVLESYSESGRGEPSEVLLNYEGDELYCTIDNAIPLGLIVNELVSNALEHAFSPEQGGTVGLRLQKTDPGMILEVSDNGKGFSLKDEDEEHMGMTLIRALTGQLQGEIERINRQDSGSLFRISVPQEVL